MQNVGFLMLRLSLFPVKCLGGYVEFKDKKIVISVGLSMALKVLLK